MPDSQIIDNRSDQLVDRISQILESTDAVKFAVGYLFVSGLEAISTGLEDLKEVKLLIGNTTNRSTIEQLAESHGRLESVQDAIEKQAYPKRVEEAEMADETARALRNDVELTDQTDEKQRMLALLTRLVDEGRLATRVYTKGRLHAKAYIFDYGDVFDQQGQPVDRLEDGIAIVGSSNLSLSGISSNTELNVVVQGNPNHAALTEWFEELWKESEDFDERLMTELQSSWALATPTPYDVYLKTLYTLVSDRLESAGPQDELLWQDDITASLADFQKVAVRQAIQLMRDFGGCFVADVVGLGKSFIGAALLKHFERVDRARPLVICPAPLVEMWEEYNEQYGLNARVLSMGKLREDQAGDQLASVLDDVKYRDRDLILIDESHNFRHSDIQRYRVLQQFMARGRRACLLTATPRNKSVWDIYNQIKLFHVDDVTELPIDPPNLREYFKLIEDGDRELQALLTHVLIRRTRNHVLRWYGFDASTHQPVDPTEFREYMEGRKRAYVLVAGEPQFFPKRILQTVEYSIEDTYQGLYEDLRQRLGGTEHPEPGSPVEGELCYARYGLWHYVKPEHRQGDDYAALHRTGPNLRGLMRILLFKRFESSVYAFRETIKRLMAVHTAFLDALGDGFVPAGEAAQKFLYESDYEEEGEFLDALRELSTRYSPSAFDLEALAKDIEHDLGVLGEIFALVEKITPEKDTKLQTLLTKLSEPPLADGKRLIFTQYADTAQYLYDNLPPGDDLDVIFSGDKSKARVVARFAPKANPQFNRSSADTELNTLIATDVLSEGLNLQDSDKIINYDLHWNPVRLIQRFGRIDRIGTEFDEIYGFNFLPETALERNLGLKEKLQRRIQDIHDTIGEDTSILDPGERLNEEAMYAIYEQAGGRLADFEEEDALDLSEAEEMLRQLRADAPEEFQRIQNLRDGIRSAIGKGNERTFVFCRSGRYRQLFLLDESGEVVTRDTGAILRELRCEPATGAAPLPEHHNRRVSEVTKIFRDEVKQREAELRHRPGLTQGQRYCLRELEAVFAGTEDELVRRELEVLEEAFRAPVPGILARQLNSLRRNGVSGDDLVKHLQTLFHEYGMKTWTRTRAERAEEEMEVRVVCSEALP